MDTHPPADRARRRTVLGVTAHNDAISLIDQPASNKNSTPRFFGGSEDSTDDSAWSRSAIVSTDTTRSSGVAVQALNRLRGRMSFDPQYPASQPSTPPVGLPLIRPVWLTHPVPNGVPHLVADEADVTLDILGHTGQDVDTASGRVVVAQ